MNSERHTLQKAIIAQAVRELDHPVAVQVYSRVRESLPNISLGTVYRVLGNMAQRGEVLRVHFANGDDVFDKTSIEHCHFRCRCCARVVDVATPLPSPTLPDGYYAEDVHLEFTGLCASCASSV